MSATGISKEIETAGQLEELRQEVRDCRRGTSQCGKYEAGTDFGGRMLVQRDCIA